MYIQKRNVLHVCSRVRSVPMYCVSARLSLFQNEMSFLAFVGIQHIHVDGWTNLFCTVVHAKWPSRSTFCANNSRTCKCAASIPPSIFGFRVLVLNVWPSTTPSCGKRNPDLYRHGNTRCTDNRSAIVDT